MSASARHVSACLSRRGWPQHRPGTCEDGLCDRIGSSGVDNVFGAFGLDKRRVSLRRLVLDRQPVVSRVYMEFVR